VDPLSKFLARIGGFWKGLNSAQRIAALSIVLIVGGTITLLASIARQPDYATLYSDLSPEDARRILDELGTMKVPFQLTHAGTAVQVPLDRVYDLRLELAARGLPSSGPVGFETFDDSGLGLTPFQEKVRFRRALEGELSRTITRLSSVDSARVHISLPDRALFQRDRSKATAAVVLGLKPGREISPGEAAGIRHLIAGSVEGLESAQVTLVDARGRLLARPGGSGDHDALAAEALDVQRSVERVLADRAQTLIDAALGMGTSVVTVSAEVDRRRVEEEHNRIHPNETTVLSEQRSEETRSEPGPVSYGIPGTQGNVPDGFSPTAGDTAPSTEQVSRETVNFDVSRTKSHSILPMGSIQRLSVAVLLDGRYATPPAANTEEGSSPAAPVYQPRSAEEIAQISEIVKRAVGFDEKRGDQISVQNLQFRQPLDDVGAAPIPFWRSPELLLLLPGLARAFVVLGGLLLLIFFVLRPALRQLAMVNVIAPGTSGGASISQSYAGASGATGAPGPAGEIPIGPDEIHIPVTKDHAKVVAETMKQWLRE
jgi:flagellar M-ring protein FliF